MAKFIKDNCAKLADRVVDNMDLKDLMRCMAEQIEENYSMDEKLFQSDWLDYNMDEEDYVKVY